MTASIVPTTRSMRVPSHSGIGDRLAKKGLKRLLSRIQTGQLTLMEGGDAEQFGNLSPEFPLQATIGFTPPGFIGSCFSEEASAPVNPSCRATGQRTT